MRYFEIYAWTDCPFCEHAKQLLIEKGEQFMFCCLDQSDSLLKFLKQKYNVGAFKKKLFSLVKSIEN